MLESEVKQIESDRVTLQLRDGPTDVPNDFVFVFAGGELPTPFLKKIGIQIDTKFGEA